MDDDPLEEKRVLHEQRDRLEMAIVDEMLAKKSGHKEQLDSQHRQRRLLDEYMASSNHLLQLYSKEETTRTNLGGDVDRACNDFYVQYNKLCSRYGNSGDDDPIDIIETANDLLVDSLSSAVVVAADANTQSVSAKVEKLVEFTDEEGYGKYLDLNESYEAYLQVVKKGQIKPRYLDFLMMLSKVKYELKSDIKSFEFMDELDREKKLSSAYKNFVEKLLNYFRDYSRRAKPLFDYKTKEDKIQARFLEGWHQKSFKNWFSDEERDQVPMIELESYRSIEELMKLEPDSLKQELKVRGLKCGGTLEERAKRLWAVRGKNPDEVEDTLKNVAGNKSEYIASLEAKLTAYIGKFFYDHLEASIEEVKRKQARTVDERNESDDDDISDVEDEENDQNNVIYNPKNLPLGWDGKPIPYWLYKLHGLNMTFTCEICGNTTYKGPKAFQRHFAEQRHAHGMKCLGIPNTSHFANITSIQDAIALWDKLKVERQKDSFQPQVEEEYEDSQGNVVNKKTYEDLKRQGLL